jgi:hypothetical protein
VSGLEQLTIFCWGSLLKIGREFKVFDLPVSQIPAHHFFNVYKQKTQENLNQRCITSTKEQTQRGSKTHAHDSSGQHRSNRQATFCNKDNMMSQKGETSIANSKMQKSSTKNNELLKPVIFLKFLLRPHHLARDVRTLVPTTAATLILISILSGRMEI